MRNMRVDIRIMVKGYVENLRSANTNARTNSAYVRDVRNPMMESHEFVNYGKMIFYLHLRVYFLSFYAVN